MFGKSDGDTEGHGVPCTYRFEAPRQTQYAVRGGYLPRGEGGDGRITCGVTRTRHRGGRCVNEANFVERVWRAQKYVSILQKNQETIIFEKS